MMPSLISVTHLQRQLKKVLASKKEPFRLILCNNTVSGMVISREAAEIILQSGLLDQLREELWELNDPETCQLVRNAREGKGKPVPFDTVAKKYGL